MDQLLELSTLSSEQLMLLQKQDELEHSNCSRSQISVAKKLLPNAKEFNSAILNEIEIISTIDGDPNFSVGLWQTLRQRISSLEYFRGLGRGMKFFIGFRNKRKRFRLLGIVEFASDSQRLKVRDNLIGWNDDQRSKNREHLVNVSTCVATQPFGHDYLGMKFLVSLFPRLVKKWETKYQTKIVAVITTSIHGNKSVYRGIPFLKNIGKSSGQQLLKPLRLEWHFWNTWLNEHFAEDLEILKSRSSPLQTRLKFLYQVLGFDQKEFYHSHQRGVFLMPLFTNWTEFLRGEIKEKKLVPISSEDWINWWMNKSTGRTEKLKKKNDLLNEKYFLDDYDQKMIQRWMTQVTI